MSENKVPAVGEAAPTFQAESSTGPVNLADYQGKQSVVLYFYPKDFTGGCTAQACSFRDNYGLIGQYDAVLFGISGDGEDSHARFKAK